MPKIAEKTKTDPFMKKYWDLNEAGHYKKAHDLMVTYKIEKYGADVGQGVRQLHRLFYRLYTDFTCRLSFDRTPNKVKAWGMEYTSPWAPVVHLQNKGDYKQGKHTTSVFLT